VARLPVLDDETLEDEDYAGGEPGLDAPAMPRGPQVRLGAVRSSSSKAKRSSSGSTATASKRSHHKKPTSSSLTGSSAPRARTAPRAKADPLTEWAGELAAGGLQWVTLKLAGGGLFMHRAEALGITKPLARLLRRNVLPATVIDIDMPDEDKRDISLLLVTLGRYVGRVLERRMMPPAARQAQAQATQAATNDALAAQYAARYAFDAGSGDGPEPVPEPGPEPEMSIDELLAQTAAFQAAPQAAGPRSVPVMSSSGGDGDGFNVPAAVIPGADPSGFTRLIAAGVLPGFSGSVDSE